MRTSAERRPHDHTVGLGRRGRLLVQPQRPRLLVHEVATELGPDADYTAALSAAHDGLRGAPQADGAVAWGLELVLLEAFARSGHGEAAIEQLQSLATRYPRRMPPSQYSATASQLSAEQ